MIPRFSIFKNISSLTCLNISQFLIGINDSIFRLLVVYSLVDTLGMEKSHVILTLTGLLFVLPFLLFSMPAGELSDRYSKRTLILWMMAFEIVAIGFGVIAIYYKAVMASYCALFLVALQAAFYTPARTAIVPEIVPLSDITKANGYLSLSSFGAVILGIFFASFASEITARNYTFVALVSFGFALIAFFFSFGIKKTPIQNPQKKIHVFFLFEIFRSLKNAHQYPLLIVSLVASGFFFFTAGFTQLNILPFGIQSLGLNELQTGYLFMAAAFGVGIGSLLAIIFSGKGVDLGLSILGAIGTAFSYMLLYYFQNSLFLSVFFIILLGIHGGLFIVPLNAYAQVVSPERDRGSILAAGNFLTFVFISFAPASVYVLEGKFHLSGAEGFFYIGIVCLIVGIWFALKAPHHLAQLLKRPLLSSLVKKILFKDPRF